MVSLYRKSVIDPCSDVYVHAYMNRHDVQEALHANVTRLDHDWASCRFIDKLKLEIHGKGLLRQLVVLYNIYALSLLHKHQGEFLVTSSITAKQASLATAQLRNLYSQVAIFYF